ncbi:MAG: hypothetical protein ACTSQP_23980 [Promethearchaeota archaeon]
MIILFTLFEILLSNLNAQDYYGVIIGAGTQEIQNICDDDAQQLKNHLITYLGWCESKLVLKLHNDFPTPIMVYNLIQQMPKSEFSKRLFYYSGHGTREGLDFPNTLDILTPAKLEEYFDPNYPKYITIIDACYSGIFPLTMSSGYNISSTDDKTEANGI